MMYYTLIRMHFEHLKGVNSDSFIAPLLYYIDNRVNK